MWKVVAATTLRVLHSPISFWCSPALASACHGRPYAMSRRTPIRPYHRATQAPSRLRCQRGALHIRTRHKLICQHGQAFARVQRQRAEQRDTRLAGLLNARRRPRRGPTLYAVSSRSTWRHTLTASGMRVGVHSGRAPLSVGCFSVRYLTLRPTVSDGESRACGPVKLWAPLAPPLSATPYAVQQRQTMAAGSHSCSRAAALLESYEGEDAGEDAVEGRVSGWRLAFSHSALHAARPGTAAYSCAPLSAPPAHHTPSPSHYTPSLFLDPTCHGGDAVLGAPALETGFRPHPPPCVEAQTSGALDHIAILPACKYKKALWLLSLRPTHLQPPVRHSSTPFVHNYPLYHHRSSPL